MALRNPSAIAVAAVAIVTGACVGTGTAALMSKMLPWRVGEFDPAAGTVRVGNDGPLADCGATTHQFGTLALGNEGRHTFVVRNAGTAPLTLTRGATSCSCTVSDFDSRDGGDESAEKTIPPGGEGTVRLMWRGKADGPFRQQATVLTNDPARPEIIFVIEGLVVPAWRAVPPSIVVTRVTAGVGEHAHADVFTFGDTPPSVVATSLLDPQTERFFKIATEPLPEGVLEAEKGATGGVRLSIDVLPDAEIGNLKQTARMLLKTSEELTVDVPIEASVAGAITVAGTAWDAGRKVLGLGVVPGRTGGRWELFLAARGPHRDSVQPRVVEVIPPSLAVTVGDAAPLGNGNVVRVPITVTIPPGSAAAAHNCTKQAPGGKIVLETGHPESPTLTIKVCVSITP